MKKNKKVSSGVHALQIYLYLKDRKGEKIDKKDLIDPGEGGIDLSSRALPYVLREMRECEDLKDEDGRDVIEFGHHWVRMRKDFSLEEIHLLLDSIYNSKSISLRQKENIEEKLSRLLPRMSPSKEKEWRNSIDVFQSSYELERGELLENLALLGKAIKEQNVVKISCGEVRLEKDDADVVAVRFSETNSVDILPFQIVVLDGFYYVFAKLSDGSEKAFRVDKILYAESLKKRPPEFKNISGRKHTPNDDLDIEVEGQLRTPFGKMENVRLLVKKDEIERVLDVFGGKSIQFLQSECDGEKIEISVAANSTDIISFLCANADIAEVIEPQRVRNAMLKISENLYKKYMATEQDRVEKAYQEALVNRHGGVLRTSDKSLRERFEREGKQDKIRELTVDQMDDAILRDMKSYCNLYELCFEDIENVDLSVLEFYPNLRRLRVEPGFSFSKEKSVHVCNTESLQKCSHLEIVTFSKTDFSDVNALRDLKELRSLYLTNGCNFETLDFIAALPALSDLHLQGSSVEDISALEHHKELFILGADQNFMERFGKKIEEIAPHLRIKISARRKSPSAPRPQGPSTANDVNHSIKRRT